jgi:hypothetical protein
VGIVIYALPLLVAVACGHPSTIVWTINERPDTAFVLLTVDEYPPSAYAIEPDAAVQLVDDYGEGITRISVVVASSDCTIIGESVREKGSFNSLIMIVTIGDGVADRYPPYLEANPPNSREPQLDDTCWPGANDN